MIKCRAVLVLSNGNFENFKKAVLLLEPGAIVIDNRDMTVTIRHDDPWLIKLADEYHALPRTAGVRIIYAASKPFGYDDAGTPFDVGHWAAA